MLSPRLQTICDWLLPDQDVWDACCDHGYIGQWALKEKRYRQIYFVDQVPEIIERLKSKLATSNASFFDIDLAKLEQPIFGNLVVSGVGSYKIIEILRNLQKSNNLKVQRIILGPQNNPHLLTDLELGSFQKVHEISIAEKGRKRILMVYDRI